MSKKTKKFKKRSARAFIYGSSVEAIQHSTDAYSYKLSTKKDKRYAYTSVVITGQYGNPCELQFYGEKGVKQLKALTKQMVSALNNLTDAVNWVKEDK